MSTQSNQAIFEVRRRFFAIAGFMAAVVFILAACSSKPTEPGRRFHLHGKVVAVSLADGALVVDHDAIPGYMDAMTMSYAVHDKRALTSLKQGDEITADVVVVNDIAHLENIVVVKPASQPAPTPSSDFHMPQPGEAVPDFALIDQSGRRIRLRSFRGDVLLVTFIYTRCPFADFCPKVSDAFAHVYAALESQPALARKVRLLSVSFDPDHDTPSVLCRYAASLRDTTGTTRPFDRWTFAAAPKAELPKLTKFFGLYYNEQNGQIIHSMSTSVISPDQKIVAWYHDNDWKPEGMLAVVDKALAGSGQRKGESPSSRGK